MIVQFGRTQLTIYDLNVCIHTVCDAPDYKDLNNY